MHMSDTTSNETVVRNVLRSKLTDPNPTARRTTDDSGGKWIFVGADANDGAHALPFIVIDSTGGGMDYYINGDGIKEVHQQMKVNVYAKSTTDRNALADQIGPALRMENLSGTGLHLRMTHIPDKWSEFPEARDAEYKGHIPPIYRAELQFEGTYLNNYSSS